MPFRPISMSVNLFQTQGDESRSRKALLHLMEALVAINVGWIKANQRRLGVKIPRLYQDTDVVYKPEKNTEYWQDIPSILAQGYGDCEDLTCWRVAELRVAGIAARPYLRWREHPRGNGARFHATVWLPGGKIEDPSLALGMGGHPVTRKPIIIARDP